jgi:hypothetical protein
MNPFDLDATGLMVWGLVLHLVADWLLQNAWLADNKAARRVPDSGLGGQIGRWLNRKAIIHSHWWDRHPAAYVHAGIHGVLLALVFGWVAAPLALAHLVIDTRAPVAWWSRLIRQTEPRPTVTKYYDADVVMVDVGTFVRFWNDQVWHIACIAIAALAVTV